MDGSGRGTVSAGEMKPALRHEEPAPAWRRSTTSTSTPCSCSDQAHDRPTIPAPTTTTRRTPGRPSTAPVMPASSSRLRCSGRRASRGRPDAIGQPAAEVDAVDLAVGASGEVTPHALGRAVRDDEGITLARHHGQRHRRLGLGLLAALLPQGSGHVRLELDAGHQPAVLRREGADRGDRLVAAGVDGQRVVAQDQLLRLLLLEPEIVLEGPGGQLVVELRAVGAAVAHADEGEPARRHHEEVRVLPVGRPAVADQPLAGDVAQQPGDADVVAEGAPPHVRRGLLHALQELLRQEARPVRRRPVPEVEPGPGDLVGRRRRHAAGRVGAARQGPRAFDGDAAVLVAGVADGEAAGHDVVGEEPRVAQAERFEDQLLHGLLVRLARDLLDEPAGEGERRVVVADRGPEGRDQLDGGHPLDVAGEGVVAVAGVLDEVALPPGRVVEQLQHGDPLGHVGVLEPELGDVRADGRVEVHPAVLHEAQHRRGRERLARRPELEEGLLVDGQRVLDAADAVIAEDPLAVDEHGGGHAGHLQRLAELVQLLLQVVAHPSPPSHSTVGMRPGASSPESMARLALAGMVRRSKIGGARWWGCTAGPRPGGPPAPPPAGAPVRRRPRPPEPPVRRSPTGAAAARRRPPRRPAGRPGVRSAPVPTGDVRPRVPLARVVEAFGPSLLRVLAAPHPSDASDDVLDVVIYDPADVPAARPGDLVLAVGVRDPDEVAYLAGTLAPCGVAGLVAKVAPSEASAWLADPPAGTPILGLEPDASWSYVSSLVRSLLTAAGGAGDPAEDLFGLADAVSALVNAPVTIEDTTSRVLAFSGRQEETDTGRHDTILGRQVPDQYLRLLEERGVFRWLARESTPIYVEPLSAVMQAREAVSVRAGGELLGSMWAVVKEPLDAQRERAFSESAKVVALHLLRLRAEGDASRRMQAELVATVLEGGHGAVEAAARLGIASGPLCVVAAQPLVVEPSHQAAACQQVRQRLAVHSAAVRSHSAVALVGGVVYGIFAGRDADDAVDGPVVSLAEEFVARPGGIDVVVGIGRSVRTNTEVGRSRVDADRALRVLRHEALDLGSRRRVARFADVQSGSLLLRLSDLAAEDGELLAGPLGALLDYDEEHRSGLVDTVAAHLDSFGDVAAAAASLHIHPNTFRYRLRRATEVSGLDLADPDARLAVMLQLRLRRAGRR